MIKYRIHTPGHIQSIVEGGTAEFSTCQDKQQAQEIMHEFLGRGICAYIEEIKICDCCDKWVPNNKPMHRFGLSARIRVYCENCWDEIIGKEVSIARWRRAVAVGEINDNL